MVYKENERQFMLNDRYEIFEKRGIAKTDIQLHYHNFYEIIHILDGVFITHIDGYEYRLRAGDFLLIDSAKIHCPNFEPVETHDNHRLVLWITKEMISSISAEGVDLRQCFFSGPAFHFSKAESKLLSKLLISILINDEKKELFANNLLIQSYFVQFFINFNRFCISKNYTKPQSNHYYTLLDNISAYIDSHITESISVEELAESVYMSKFYFLRKFKKETSITAHDFIIHKRLIKACECIESGIPVSKVYEHCGFNDYSSFFRNFKSVYKISPKNYRRYI